MEVWRATIKEIYNDSLLTPEYVMRTLQEAADGITDGMPVIVSIDDEYYHCTNELIAIKYQNDYEYPPMNKKQPVWSDEDDMNTLVFINALELYNNPVDKVLLKSWIKSFKYRCRSQSKQEWSEEDENMRGNLLGYLNGFSVSETAKHQMFDWLKSLRPQTQWKPTEAQMWILEYVTDRIPDKMYLGTMKGLINDLKKL